MPKTNKKELAAWLQRANPLVDFRIQEILSITDLKGKRCLDVGFGRGQFIGYLKRLGAETGGIDLDPAAVALVKDAIGADVRLGTIFDLPDERKFDLIVMNDLLEHPLNPLEILQKADSLLNPLGLIAILTPNASFATEEEEPMFLRVNLEHMQYLTLGACNFLARHLSLEVVHLEAVGFPVLHGMDRPPCESVHKKPMSARMKEAVLAGIRPATRAVNRLMGREGNRDRLGRYHLFCILRKRGETCPSSKVHPAPCE